MIYEVIKEHVSNDPNPIQLQKGDYVTFTDRLSGPEGYERWVYCVKEDSEQKGWVPEQVIYKYHDEKGIIMRDYIARELNVQSGDKFQIIEELNGWVWGKLIPSNEKGWLPKDHLEPSRE